MTEERVEKAVVAAEELPDGLTATDVATGRRVYLILRGRRAEGPELDVLVRTPGQIHRVSTTTDRFLAWASDLGPCSGEWAKERLSRLSTPSRTFAGMRLDRPLVMGIVNVTPDSFSDGGETPDTSSAVARGEAMLEAGADILDIGGESTRPGAQPVPPEEEARRVLPVVKALAATGATVSIDTRRASVMAAALDAGAKIVNDVTALTGDAASLPTVAERKAPVILMHMQGEPRTMQADPQYAFAPLDVFDRLEDRVAACVAAGLPRHSIAVDPGIGFGKRDVHNLQIIACLGVLRGLGGAVVLGVSRKSFIGRLGRGEVAQRRLAGSLAAALSGLDRGADILRVHDVAETRQAVAVWQAIRQRGDAP